MKITKHDTPSGMKIAFYVPLSIEKNKKGVDITGICSFCSRWSAELREGVCKEEDCIHGRELEAIATGSIEHSIDGLAGGVKVLSTSQGTIVTKAKQHSPKKLNRFGLKKLKAMKAKQEAEALAIKEEQYKIEETRIAKLKLKAEWKKNNKKRKSQEVID